MGICEIYRLRISVWRKDISRRLVSCRAGIRHIFICLFPARPRRYFSRLFLPSVRAAVDHLFSYTTSSVQYYFFDAAELKCRDGFSLLLPELLVPSSFPPSEKRLDRRVFVYYTMSFFSLSRWKETSPSPPFATQGRHNNASSFFQGVATLFVLVLQCHAFCCHSLTSFLARKASCVCVCGKIGGKKIRAIESNQRAGMRSRLTSSSSFPPSLSGAQRFLTVFYWWSTKIPIHFYKWKKSRSSLYIAKIKKIAGVS